MAWSQRLLNYGKHLRTSGLQLEADFGWRNAQWLGLCIELKKKSQQPEKPTTGMISGGDGGIWTHGPLRINWFRVRVADIICGSFFVFGKFLDILPILDSRVRWLLCILWNPPDRANSAVCAIDKYFIISAPVAVRSCICLQNHSISIFVKANKSKCFSKDSSKRFQTRKGRGTSPTTN